MRTKEADPSSLVDSLELEPAARRSLLRWLSESRYDDDRADLAARVSAAAAGDTAARDELADAFAGPLPIGTGGRRGTVGPGPNRFNGAVVRETAQGVADALSREGDAPRVVIVYDTRRDSAAFAKVAAEQLAAADLEVILVDAPRPTPQLSFLVRHLGAGAGVVISASHNPPSDNGIKIYGPDGAQVLGARDRALMDAILAAAERPSLPTPTAAQRERIEVIDATKIDALDRAYHAYVTAQGVVDGSLAPTGLVVSFSPLHGVGHTSVLPVLRGRGLTVHAVAAQCDADGGRFSTVKSANPEQPEALTMARALAEETGAPLVLATDPDADRLGALARSERGYEFIDGNRLGALMLDHVLRHRRSPTNAWVLTTLVTTPLVATLARAHGVDVVDDLLVGFKHHAGMIREAEERPVVFACEESHGYSRGNGVRDKDGAVAALLLSECAALAHAEGRTLHDELARIWCEHGYHRERTANIVVTGLAGRQAIASVMARFREQPPTEIGGLAVVDFEDRSRPRATGSATRDLPGDVLCFELAGPGQACRLVLRPSGTEPKLKVYALARSRPERTAGRLDEARATIDALVDHVLADAEAQVRAGMGENAAQ
ncbi:MAG: phospho-sugar mutase [Myxococcales bacterium]|nr:phospho-sugar mutase [Myxococcales bacterium]